MAAADTGTDAIDAAGAAPIIADRFGYAVPFVGLPTNKVVPPRTIPDGGRPWLDGLPGTSLGRRKIATSGVFAPLVGALVFKTSGGFDKSSQWVRFPYTPALPPGIE